MQIHVVQRKNIIVLHLLTPDRTISRIRSPVRAPLKPWCNAFDGTEIAKPALAVAQSYSHSKQHIPSPPWARNCGNPVCERRFRLGVGAITPPPRACATQCTNHRFDPRTTLIYGDISHARDGTGATRPSSRKPCSQSWWTWRHARPPEPLSSYALRRPRSLTRRQRQTQLAQGNPSGTRRSALSRGVARTVTLLQEMSFPKANSIARCFVSTTPYIKK